MQLQILYSYKLMYTDIYNELYTYNYTKEQEPQGQGAQLQAPSLLAGGLAPAVIVKCLYY